jgi:hypothetical protein
MAEQSEAKKREAKHCVKISHLEKWVNKITAFIVFIYEKLDVEKY